MKKFITALTVLLTLTVSVSAMSYTQAREQALFLTDKMAYELNLSEEQYEAAYEVNLDYLMSVNTYDDLYGTYWTNRNLDLSYILLDWQYRAFCAANYFYRPLYWDAGLWHFSIYARYPRRSFFYFGRPDFFATYRGGHGWHDNGGRSWYRGRDFGHNAIAGGRGMKDRFERGDFGRTQNHSMGRGGGRFQGNNGNNRFGDNSRNNGSRSFGNNRDFDRNNGSQSRSNGIFNRGTNNGDRSQRIIGNGRSTGIRSAVNNAQNNVQRQMGGNRGEIRSNRESSTRTTVRPQQRSNSVGNSFSGGSRSVTRSTQTRPSNTFTPRQSSSSSSSVRSMPSRSMGGSSSVSRPSGGSNGGGSNGGHSGGGIHAGGRR